MNDAPPGGASNAALRIMEEALGELARNFPVMASSDEFHYFPQIDMAGVDAPEWDRLEPDLLGVVASRLRGRAAELDELAPGLGRPLAEEADMAARVCRAIARELEITRPWRRQPTLYFTIASIGLAERLEAGDQAGFVKRLEALPGFFGQAGDNLSRVPSPYLELGIEMGRDFLAWLRSLGEGTPDTGAAASGMESAASAATALLGRLDGIEPVGDFRLGPEALDAVVRESMGTGAGVEEVLAEIETEIAETREAMALEAAKLGHGGDFEKALEDIPGPAPDTDLFGLYAKQVGALATRCREAGLIGAEQARSAPVLLAPIPEYLRAVRSAAAYSVIAGHPPRGGVFYLMDEKLDQDIVQVLHRDCAFLCAHEAWPGHHLLDFHRWNHESPVRRCLEFPLFYEGWACFGEELMQKAGAIEGPRARLVLARRHYWRALRGKAELSLNAGLMDFGEAAELLVRSGMAPARAAAVVRKYSLKPGYQPCYTIGLRRFRELFGKHGRHDPWAFARRVLAGGEVGFDYLESALGDA